MKNRQDSSGGSREQGFELSYRLAAEQLSQISDIEAQCHKSGARYIGTNKIVIDYLSQSYHITIPDAQISLKNSEIEVPLKAQLQTAAWWSQLFPCIFPENHKPFCEALWPKA
jgi:hypothetical protein